jgi:hypothetical protein
MHMREHAAFPQNSTAHRPSTLGGWSVIALCRLWMLVALQTSTLAACGGGLVPVHNIHNAPIVVQHGEVPTPPRVHDAIVRALASRNWQLNREGPDGIVATLISGGHSATVQIRYDEHTYSIEYLDSSPGLRFNGSAIHRKYNDWVERLYRSIRANLLDPRYAGPEVEPVAPAALPPTAGPTPQSPPVSGPPVAAPPAAAAPPPAGAPRPPSEHDELPPPPPPPPPPTAPRK